MEQGSSWEGTSLLVGMSVSGTVAKLLCGWVSTMSINGVRIRARKVVHLSVLDRVVLGGERSLGLHRR